MTENDLKFIKKLIDAGLIRSPVLELGAGYGGSTCREEILTAGLAYKTTDISAGAGVDFVANFEENVAIHFGETEFGTVLVLNVLEHVFEPIKVLDNAVSIVRKGGSVVVCTPCVWPVHNYPRDCQRLLPDWYVTYDERRPKLRLVDEYFEFVGKGKISSFERDGERHIPPPWRSGAERHYSRLVHRLFNTTGRGQWAANHVSVGAVFEKIG